MFDNLNECLCQQLAEKAGLPAGVLNVVTSSRQNASSVGQVLCQSPLVTKISFTGSTAVGKVSQHILIQYYGLKVF